ncbi:hypothetical protein D3C85_813100 [compost metagenome]
MFRQRPDGHVGDLARDIWKPARLDWVGRFQCFRFRDFLGRGLDGRSAGTRRPAQQVAPDQAVPLDQVAQGDTQARLLALHGSGRRGLPASAVLALASAGHSPGDGIGVGNVRRQGQVVAVHHHTRAHQDAGVGRLRRGGRTAQGGKPVPDRGGNRHHWELLAQLRPGRLHGQLRMGDGLPAFGEHGRPVLPLVVEPGLVRNGVELPGEYRDGRATQPYRRFVRRGEAEEQACLATRAGFVVKRIDLALGPLDHDDIPQVLEDREELLQHEIVAVVG